MNIYSLALKAQQKPEVLERILRVIRHRGFNIANLNVSSHNQDININMSVESNREISLLTNQLNKLIDVVDCEVLIQDFPKSVLQG